MVKCVGERKARSDETERLIGGQVLKVNDDNGNWW